MPVPSWALRLRPSPVPVCRVRAAAARGRADADDGPGPRPRGRALLLGLAAGLVWPWSFPGRFGCGPPRVRARRLRREDAPTPPRPAPWAGLAGGLVKDPGSRIQGVPVAAAYLVAGPGLAARRAWSGRTVRRVLYLVPWGLAARTIRPAQASTP